MVLMMQLMREQIDNPVLFIIWAYIAGIRKKAEDRTRGDKVI